jgi:hypothetical protein
VIITTPIPIYQVYTPEHAASGTVDVTLPVAASELRLHLDANYDSGFYANYVDPGFNTATGQVTLAQPKGDANVVFNGRVSLADIHLGQSGAPCRSRSGAATCSTNSTCSTSRPRRWSAPMASSTKRAPGAWKRRCGSDARATRPSLGLGLALAASPCLAPTAFARVQEAIASRVDGRTLVADWQARGPVDVYLATRPDGPLAQARLVARGVRSGHATVRAGTSPRPYLRLRDRADGTVVTVAERWLPLAQGSNFRDLGGYPAADGKTVRWGLIYRAGATPLLTPADVAQVRGLGLATMVDLRSDEERRLAPTRLAGQVHQDAVPYSMMALFAGAQGGKMPSNGGALSPVPHAAGAAGQAGVRPAQGAGRPDRIQLLRRAGPHRVHDRADPCRARHPARGDPARL